MGTFFLHFSNFAVAFFAFHYTPERLAEPSPNRWILRDSSPFRLPFNILIKNMRLIGENQIVGTTTNCWKKGVNENCQRKGQIQTYTKNAPELREITKSNIRLPWKFMTIRHIHSNRKNVWCWAENFFQQRTNITHNYALKRKWEKIFSSPLHWAGKYNNLWKYEMLNVKIKTILSIEARRHQLKYGE